MFDHDARSLPLPLRQWRDAAPKRRVEVTHARVGGARSVVLYRGRSRAHFASVRGAIDALASAESRARIVWIHDGPRPDEARR